MSVKRRVVYYLSGFDPRGVRHYYKMYKEEAAKESGKDGISIEISNRKRTSKNAQSCNIIYNSYNNHNKIKSTITEYHFFQWDDIIRKHWAGSIFSIYRDLFFFIWTYMPNGLIIKLGKLAPFQMIAAFYPVLYLIGTPLIALLIGHSVYDYIAKTHQMLALLGAIIGFFGIMLGSLHIGNKIAVFWLLRIYAFCAQYGYGDVPELEERIENFAEQIAQTLMSIEEKEIDEVLVVSHSVGTIIAIPILAKAIALSKANENALKKLSVMSLGECIALVSFMPTAIAYREAMLSLNATPYICWLDYTSAIDGACSVQLDFYKHSGIIAQRSDIPRYLSPRFHTLYTAEKYAFLSRNKYLAHFLYLMATEKDGNYNFIQMTAGHQRLCAWNDVKHTTQVI